MKDGQDGDRVPANQVEDAEREATSKSAADAAMDNLILLGIPLDRRQGRLDDEQEFSTEASKL